MSHDIKNVIENFNFCENHIFESVSETLINSINFDGNMFINLNYLFIFNYLASLIIKEYVAFFFPLIFSTKM